MTKQNSSNIYYYSVFLILLANSLIWLKSSLGKISDGKFVDTLSGTLTKFASNNPHPWYKSLLENTAIPNSQIFGNLIMWGETFVAVISTISILILIIKQKDRIFSYLLALGLLGGILLNTSFWFAAGWTSPSTYSLNLLMLTVQVVGLLGVIAKR